MTAPAGSARHGRACPTSTTFARGLRCGRAAGRCRPRWWPTWRRRSRPCSSSPTGRPYSFLLESVEGGAVRGRYSILGIKPDLIWRCRGDAGRDQPARARSTATRSSPAPSRRWTACARCIAESRIELPDGPAADGRRPVRLHGLRHGPADRAPARRQPGPAGPARRRVPAADRGGAVRPYRGPDHGRDAGLAEPGAVGAAGLRPGLRAAGRRGRRVQPRHQPRAAPDARARRRSRWRTSPASSTTRWSSGRRSTSAPATSSRWCPRSASSCRSTCRRSRSTGRCAGSTRRRSCSSSTSTATRWWAPARRSWCGCATARSPSGRSPAPAGAASTRPRTRRWPQELLADPKELAEHLMLLDLGRNDVGRVARIGTVRGHREDEGRVLLATSCTSSRTSRAASGPTATRSTR